VGVGFQNIKSWGKDQEGQLKWGTREKGHGIQAGQKDEEQEKSIFRRIKRRKKKLEEAHKEGSQDEKEGVSITQWIRP